MAESSPEERYRTTLDSLLEGFQIIGRDWTYLYVNAAAAGHGRRSVDDLLGRKMWEAYPGIEGTPLFRQLEQCMADRSAASLENLFAFPDGGARWFELRVHPVPEGLCIHSVDIQSRKDAQQELERLNAELERRVAARTRDLEEVNRELESFSYSVSHDLRAPVRHIGGFAAALVEDASSRLTDGEKDLLDRIVRAAQRMSTMIDDLLTFSRVGRAALAMEPVDLIDVVEAARADLVPECAGRDIVWDVQPLPRVHGDAGLLRLAIVNLLSNAVKYTRGRAPAQITIGSSADGATGDPVVWVRDNGAGFAMASATKLFGVFQRLHDNEEFEGTGIGLANVRRIVARHGGRVWAEASVGVGATFFISLPSVPVIPPA